MDLPYVNLLICVTPSTAESMSPFQVRLITITIRIITNINSIIGNVTMITNSVVVGEVEIVVLILTSSNEEL